MVDARGADAEVEVRTHELASGNVLDFTSPILFQKKPIGAVHLGIYEAPLASSCVRTSTSASGEPTSVATGAA